MDEYAGLAKAYLGTGESTSAHVILISINLTMTLLCSVNTTISVQATAKKRLMHQRLCRINKCDCTRVHLPHVETFAKVH